MRRIFLPSIALAMGILMLGSSLFAHHGTGVAYEKDKWITLKGTVTEWIWSNPHCGILFDVTDDQGNVVHWGAELGNPHQLSAAGFSKDVHEARGQSNHHRAPFADPARRGSSFIIWCSPMGARSRWGASRGMARKRTRNTRQRRVSPAGFHPAFHPSCRRPIS